nr:DinI-like family protein [Escherichia coli]
MRGVRQQQDEPGRFSICSRQAAVVQSELYRNLRPLYPKTVIRIRKGSSNGVELTGLQLDEERKQVMKIMQKVWEDDSWLH